MTAYAFIVWYSLFGWPSLYVGTSPSGDYTIWNIHGSATGSLPFSNGVMRVRWRPMTKQEIIKHYILGGSK